MSKRKTVRLGEITSVITKGTTPTTLGFHFQEKGINFIKIECITENGDFLTNKFEHISEICHDKLQRSQLSENDILFSIAGAIGRIAFVTADILPANTNQALSIIRLDSSQFNHQYVIYALKSDFVYKQFEKQKQGVAQLNISLKNISDLEIPCLPLEIQHQIVGNLDRVTQLIDLCNKILDRLDLLVKSRFVEMFRNHHFPQVAIAELVDQKIPTVKKICSSEDMIKYIDISSIDNRQNSITGYIEYILSEAPSRAQQHIQKNDILISTVRPNLRNVAMTLFDEDNLIASSGFCVLRAKKCLPSYLMTIACSDEFTDAMTKVVTGANYPAIKNSDVMKYIVSFPPLELQKQFDGFVKQIDKSKQAVKQILSRAETLKKALMQEYFA